MNTYLILRPKKKFQRMMYCEKHRSIEKHDIEMLDTFFNEKLDEVEMCFWRTCTQCLKKGDEKTTAIFDTLTIPNWNALCQGKYQNDTC